MISNPTKRKEKLTVCQSCFCFCPFPSLSACWRCWRLLQPSSPSSEAPFPASANQGETSLPAGRPWHQAWEPIIPWHRGVTRSVCGSLKQHVCNQHFIPHVRDDPHSKTIKKIRYSEHCNHPVRTRFCSCQQFCSQILTRTIAKQERKQYQKKAKPLHATKKKKYHSLRNFLKMALTTFSTDLHLQLFQELR